MESRITRLEADVVHLKDDVARIHVDLREIRVDLKGIHQAIANLTAELRGGLSSLETRIIKWLVATTITSIGVSFTIAKFVS